MEYRLDVPFQEKDAAKAFGARWNPSRRYWYYEGSKLPDGLIRWYQGRKETGDRLTKTPAQKKDSIFRSGEDLAKYKTVSQISRMIARSFEVTPEFRNIMVKGEVTNYSGHTGKNYYFSLKDEQALLPCFLWEANAASVLTFELKQGQQVALIGTLDFYAATGKASLIVKRIVNIGDGAASLAYLQLKERLQAEGLFDADHKKVLPKHPKTIGIITSKDGQAIKDICKVASKRNPYVQLMLYHVKVQGKDAAASIVEGIRALDTLSLDLIIVGRGGGSDEELMAYNEESVARAVYEAQTPIISAVGHEGHWTLIDYVSDKRAATPSEAAEEAVPNIMHEQEKVEALKKSIRIHMQNQLIRRSLRLEAKLTVLETYNPEKLIKNREERLIRLSEELKRRMQTAYETRKNHLSILLARLNGMSPTAKLVGGFGYISQDGKPVKSIDQVHTGQTLRISIHDGELQAAVTEVHKKGGSEHGEKEGMEHR